VSVTSSRNKHRIKEPEPTHTHTDTGAGGIGVWREGVRQRHGNTRRQLYFELYLTIFYYILIRAPTIVYAMIRQELVYAMLREEGLIASMTRLLESMSLSY